MTELKSGSKYNFNDQLLHSQYGGDLTASTHASMRVGGSVASASMMIGDNLAHKYKEEVEK